MSVYNEREEWIKAGRLIVLSDGTEIFDFGPKPTRVCEKLADDGIGFCDG